MIQYKIILIGSVVVLLMSVSAYMIADNQIQHDNKQISYILNQTANSNNHLMVDRNTGEMYVVTKYIVSNNAITWSGN